MITIEQLIEAFINEISEETLEECLDIFNNLFDHEDKIDSLQWIISELNLSFYIRELVQYWLIAYYEKWDTIIHIGNPEMVYDSINDLLQELNAFENLVLN